MKLITGVLQLASIDHKSSAERAGEIVGTAIGFILLLAIPVVFILCLVQLARTKKKGWLYGLIASSLPILGFLGLIGFGIYNGVKSTIATSGKARISAISSGSPRKVEVQESDITVTLPADWMDLPELNKSAALGAGNKLKEEYLVIIREAKMDIDMDLSKYSEITTEALLKKLEKGVISEPKSVIINGLPAIERELSGKIKNINICYLHVSIEGKDYLYQAIGWTMKSREKKAIPVIHGVIRSIAAK